MIKRVLSFGQCGFDHGAISRLLNSLGAEAVAADTADRLMHAARQSLPDLILVNRIGDTDGSSGLELIKKLKSDPELKRVPVMLVSNYPDAQQEAEKLGALPGFGKSALSSPDTESLLRSVLGL